MTWQNGRQPATLNNGTSSISYTYDANGMRTGKTVTIGSTSVEWEYTYEGGTLLQMKRGSRILDFSYDANGTPVALSYRSNATATPTYYYYQLNSRGDVIGLYNSSGVLTYIYEYDAYGNLLSVTNSVGVEMTSETNIANLNPLRYRGYVYDNETGFYYLQSRYYDPTTCRFINADGLVSTGQGTLGNNMFAYCMNNPICYADYTGNVAVELTIATGLELLFIATMMIVTAVAIYVVADTIIDSAPSISLPTWEFDWKWEEDKSAESNKDIVTDPPKQPPNNPVHHVVAQRDHRAEEARNILIGVGIDPVTDPANLIILPKEYHASLHTNAYYEYITSRLRLVEGDRLGVMVTLTSIKTELVLYSSLGIRWD